MDAMKWVVNRMPKTEDGQLRIMASSEIQRAKAFPAIHADAFGKT